MSPALLPCACGVLEHGGKTVLDGRFDDPQHFQTRVAATRLMESLMLQERVDGFGSFWSSSLDLPNSPNDLEDVGCKPATWFLSGGIVGRLRYG